MRDGQRTQELAREMYNEIPDTTTLDQVAARICEKLDVDIIFFNGPIYRPFDNMLIEACMNRKRRTNAMLLLVTTGGDPHAAFRISNLLQDKYERFVLYVSGLCKSAGTIVAVGAHELVISDHGELGPLDVQLTKDDDPIQMRSGLSVTQTLTALHEISFEEFEKMFLKLMANSAGSLTFKTAAEISMKLTNGLLKPITSHLDPLQIGEAERAMSIARSYGSRLLGRGQNISKEGLEYIISGYPSHGFVINRDEAEALFENVRKPDNIELKLAMLLGEEALWPKNVPLDDEAPFKFLASEPEETESEKSID